MSKLYALLSNRSNLPNIDRIVREDELYLLKDKFSKDLERSFLNYLEDTPYVSVVELNNWNARVFSGLPGTTFSTSYAITEIDDSYLATSSIANDSLGIEGFLINKETINIMGLNLNPNRIYYYFINYIFFNFLDCPNIMEKLNNMVEGMAEDKIIKNTNKISFSDCNMSINSLYTEGNKIYIGTAFTSFIDGDYRMIDLSDLKISLDMFKSAISEKDSVKKLDTAISELVNALL